MLRSAVLGKGGGWWRTETGEGVGRAYIASTRRSTRPTRAGCGRRRRRSRHGGSLRPARERVAHGASREGAHLRAGTGDGRGGSVAGTRADPIAPGDSDAAGTSNTVSCACLQTGAMRRVRGAVDTHRASHASHALYPASWRMPAHAPGPACASWHAGGTRPRAHLRCACSPAACPRVRGRTRSI